MPTSRRLARMRRVLERRQDDLCVVIENVHDPHNASAILRTCDAMGVGSVVLLYTEEVFPDISSGVSGYTRKWTSLRHFDDAAVCLATLRSEGFRVLATHLAPDTPAHTGIDWTAATAVVFGNEQRGCSPDVIAAADGAVQVPMLGMAESLNVSVAAGVILAEARRQRQRAGMYRPHWSRAKDAIWRDWLARERGGAEGEED